MSAAYPRAAVMALLADCKEDPFEDRFRLILADWLEEYGDELDQARAEIIRCQIHHGRLPVDDPVRDAHARRARWLQQRHNKAWLGPLAQWDATGSVQRGLVALTLTVTALRSKALAALAGGEPWAWVEEVRVTHAEDGDIARLAGSPLLSTINSIGFWMSRLGPAGMQSLAHQTWLECVARLDFTLQDVGDAGLRVLLRSPYLGRLRDLNLANAHLGTEAGGLLARAECAGRLRRLNLGGNQLGGLGVYGLIEHGPFMELYTLNLSANGIGDAGAAALADCTALPALRVLDLRDNAIGPHGACTLAAASNLDGLESLVLFGNPVGVEAAQRLVERFGSRVHVSPVGS